MRSNRSRTRRSHFGGDRQTNFTPLSAGYRQFALDLYQKLAADFSRIFPDAAKTPNRPYIHLARQEGIVDMNEAGTEAAAATAVGMMVTSARINPVYRADCPFVFLIRDQRTDRILLMGRLMRP